MTERFIERITKMLRELDLPDIQVESDESVRVNVPIEGTGQKVQVFVRPCGEMHGKEVLEFASCGLDLPPDDAAKMPLLILALQRNADVMLGHWGLDEGDEHSMLRVFHAQIEDTMDPPELRGAVLAVADEYSRLASALEGLQPD